MAGRSLCSGLGVETHRGGFCGVSTPTGVSNENDLGVTLPSGLAGLEVL